MSEIMKNTDVSKQATSEKQPTVSATYKDRIFRMIFKDKKEFLGLYNALNDSSYNDPEDLVVTTLDNAIYLGMKNDISFLLYDKLMLYEHQSTKNPNMPLRNLFYASDVYSMLTKDKNLFGTKIIRIPEPRFIVFYNGVVKIPEKYTMKLSSMYEQTSKQPSLELITQVLNINLGYNKKLMKKCRTLHDYAVFVDLVRRYRKDMSLEQAVEQAIDECVSKDVLADFLRTNKAEVLKMGLYEYNEEKHIQLERTEAWEEGKLCTLISIIRKKHCKGKPLNVIADEMETDIDEIRDIYQLIIQNPKLSIDEMIAELN